MTQDQDRFQAQLASLRQLVEERLQEYLLPTEGCPSRLREAMAYSLLSGGKRIRAVLVLLAAQACGGDVQRALPAACAIEMVHCYSLIHDDLPAMDDDDLRRGKPTSHKVFGEALAILAGDALLTLAFEVLARDLSPGDLAAACCLELARASGDTGMVAGQVVDLAAADLAAPTLADLEGIHQRKTGKLLCCALLLGARIAGATAAQRKTLEIYGNSVGLAFQITDDLLDLQGDPEKMGKQVQKDQSHGKLTYPVLLGVDESRRRVDDLTATAVDCANQFGAGGRALAQLAEFIGKRDH